MTELEACFFVEAFRELRQDLLNPQILQLKFPHRLLMSEDKSGFLVTLGSEIGDPKPGEIES